MIDVKRALVLAPHPDDGELGCGATIKKLTDNGVEVHYAAFTPCIKSVPDGFPKDVLYKELAYAVQCLGIQPENLMTYQFEVRELAKDRQAILEELIKLKRVIQPELVLIPNSRDIHQDHAVIHAEGFRAFKNCTVLGYDLPWNYTEVNLNFYVSVNKDQLEAKARAIEAYKSQAFRSYTDLEFLTGFARVRGVQSGNEYAEAFEVLKVVSH